MTKKEHKIFKRFAKQRGYNVTKMYDHIPNKSRLAILKHHIKVMDHAYTRGKIWRDYFFARPNIPDVRKKIGFIERARAADAEKKRRMREERMANHALEVKLHTKRVQDQGLYM